MAEQSHRRASGVVTTTTSTTTHGPVITTTSYASNNPQITVSGSGPQTSTVVSPTVTTTYSTRPPRASLTSSATQTERRPTVRIRRQGTEQGTQTIPEDAQHHDTRRRSTSEPQRPQLAFIPEDDLEIRRHVTASPLQVLHEEEPGAATPQFLAVPPAVPQSNTERQERQERPQRPGWGRQLSRQLSSLSLRPQAAPAGPYHPEYDAQVVDMLDVIDPEVATLTTLNNVQNSLFIPNLGAFYRRQPTYDLSHSRSPDTSSDEEVGVAQGYPEEEQDIEKTAGADAGAKRPAGMTRMDTISSVLTSMSEGHNYAVLPHGASLPGWTAEEKAALNDHVRHLLHSRRAKFKRSMRGFGHYVRKPVGFLVSLYAFLLTFWGAAWVLFLIGWISVGDRQVYFIEICDQILTALFCVVGIGFAPWRAVDTYHMIFVAHYAHLTWRLRKKRGLPALRDRNELPTRPETHPWETGDEPDPDAEEIVLSPAQQYKLEHHQDKLAKSHTFYKPHETTTHRAFSLRLLIAIVVLLDCHSLFQMALGGTTWGIYYKNRPKALTAVILTCSISCNISAGITISMGDKKSRKKLVVEQMFRQGLTEEALKTLRKERGLKVKGLGSQRKKREEKDMEV